MGRNEEFRKSALYHGTTHPFEIGDVVTPQTFSVAFAASDPRGASLYAASGARATGDPARLFEVEPLEDDDTYKEEHIPRTGFITATSRKGFRVVGKSTPTEKDPTGGSIRYTKE